VWFTGEQRGSLMHQHVGARPRRHDDRRIGSGEDLHGVTGHHPRIVLAAGVEGGLSAAGLPPGHHHFDTGPLENVGNRETDAWIEMIDQARGQQLHGTRPRRVRSAHADQLNSSKVGAQRPGEYRLRCPPELKSRLNDFTGGA
jgi:hypothetical protein